jgi:hypothetical protein
LPVFSDVFAEVALGYAGRLNGVGTNALRSIVNRDLLGKLNDPCLGNGVGCS